MSNLLTSRTRAQADWSCNRRRFWNYDYDDKGVIPEGTALELYLGQALHDGMAAIAIDSINHPNVNIDLIASTAFKQVHDALSADDGSFKGMQFAGEQAAMTEGLLRGFYRAVWPGLMKEYPTIIAVEKEISYDHDKYGRPGEGYTYICIPDLLLANDKGVVYIEYKSTSSAKDQWINAWANAIQVHATAHAVQETSGQPVQHTIIQGLYKGYSSYGKQSSPFCYAYHRAGNPPFSQTEYRYEYLAGFKKVPTWEMEGGVKKWVENMPDSMLAEQFPQTPPIFTNPSLVERYFSQRAIREEAVAQAKAELRLMGDDEHEKQMIMDTAFPQNFDACNPGWGRGCNYRQLCFGGPCDPLKRGFRLKEDRHSKETK